MEQGKIKQAPQQSSANFWLKFPVAVTKFAAILTNVCLVAMLAIIFLNVVLRYLIKQPLFWGDEVMTYLMIIMVSLGLGNVLLKERHISMTAFSSKLSLKKLNYLNVINSVIALAYFVYILYAAVIITKGSLETGIKSMVTLLPFAPWQAAMAFGFVILIVASILFTIKKIRIVLGIESNGKVKDPALNQ